MRPSGSDTTAICERSGVPFHAVKRTFSPDGKRLVFATPMTQPFDLGVLRLDGERREAMLFTTKYTEINARSVA